MPTLDLAASPLVTWTGPHGLPVFDAVLDADFAPAFARAMADHLAEIDAIATNPDVPTFANTIAAMELAGDALGRVSALFWQKAGGQYQ